ncbi:hypothetical protein [Deinococcus hopiensis]|nr:hypothetical protein [Deinococcus hopiensis]
MPAVIRSSVMMEAVVMRTSVMGCAFLICSLCLVYEIQLLQCGVTWIPG